MLEPWSQRHSRLVNLALVGALLAAGLAATHRTPDPALAAALTVVETLPLLARQRYPRVVLAVVLAAAITLIAVDSWLLPFQLAVALYTVATLRDSIQDRRFVLGAIAATAIAVLASGTFGFGTA